MKTNFNRRNAALAAGALALLGVSLAASPVRAQDAGAGAADSGKPISLNLISVPIKTALRTLFSSAGIRSYSIDPAVQGYANINVSDVPFTVALRSLLNSGNPPLSYTVIDGVYTVKLAEAVAPQPPVVVGGTTPPPDSGAQLADQPKRFYVIPIDSYDAFVVAQLVGQVGIVEVPPNYPAPSQGSGQNGQGGGNRSGFGGSSGFGSSSGFGGSSGFGSSTGVTTVGGGGAFGGGGGYGGAFGSGGFGR